MTDHTVGCVTYGTGVSAGSDGACDCGAGQDNMRAMHIWTGGPTVAEIQAEIDGRWVTQRWHPRLPIQILNYGQKCMFKRHWNPVTRACRGLILDSEWNVIARPFQKFFNLGEVYAPCDEIPAGESFDVFEKIDGSLGIMYWENGSPSIATRGSFMSWQALAATIWIRKTFLRPAHVNPALTYLFEYIHPNNRIVVDYGDAEKLVLLAAIETATGKDVPIDGELTAYEHAQHFNGITDYERLAAEDRQNHEGYVLVFESGRRVKVKHEEYKDLHRLVTQLTPRTIWELLKAGANLDEWVENAPPRFREWVAEQTQTLKLAFERIESDAMSDLLMKPDTDERRVVADYFKTFPHPRPAVLFAMLDEKPYDDIIWKFLRPGAADPFRVEV